MNAKPPTTTSGVKSFLGMATYCAKFIPNFSDISEPHKQSFNKIKELLTGAKVMVYIDPNKETELVTDASPSGLSAILMQSMPGKDDKRVVAYASRALTDVERRYSQTEREALGII